MLSMLEAFVRMPIEARRVERELKGRKKGPKKYSKDENPLGSGWTVAPVGGAPAGGAMPPPSDATMDLQLPPYLHEYYLLQIIGAAEQRCLPKGRVLLDINVRRPRGGVGVIRRLIERLAA